MTDNKMNKPLVVGNWKMNTNQAEASALVQSLLPALAPYAQAVEVVLLPPFPWLADIARLLQGSSIALGAQNMHTETGGAYTGEVSPRMLAGLCQYVLVGQYERRIFFSDKDAIVRRKLQVAQQHGLLPILCVGENADQLDDGLGPVVIAEQLEANLEGVRLDSRLDCLRPGLDDHGSGRPAAAELRGRHARPDPRNAGDGVLGPGSRSRAGDLCRLGHAAQHRRGSGRTPYPGSDGRLEQHQHGEFHQPGARLRQPINLNQPWVLALAPRRWPWYPTQ